MALAERGWPMPYAGHPGVSFFPEQGESAEPAKAICRRCSVATECAAYRATEGHGIWGGLSARMRSGATWGES